MCPALRGRVPISLQLLLCPVLDALGRTASRRALATGYFI
jgi:hypothetical protein